MKRHLGVYFLVSAISVVSFWVFESRIDAAGYTLIVLWFIHPLILIGISFFLVSSYSWKELVWVIICFGFVFMLVSYLTFDLANMIYFDRSNYPSAQMMLSGMAFSLFGILGGKLIATLRGHSK